MDLITADELNRSLTDDDVVVVDVRLYLDDLTKARREYDAGHIPGARFVDLHQDLADASVSNAGRHPLPTTAAFASVLGRLGISEGTRVVAYDDHNGAMAARMWWMLRSIGHSDVVVLDGGVSAWLDAGFELSQDEPVVEASTYEIESDWTSTVSAAQIGDDPDRPFVVVDSRAPERYRGDVEPIDARGGHIPGAINLFHGDVVDDDGRFRSPDQLAQHFAGLGADPVVYCGSGVTACHNLLAMSVAGISDARLFPGSWSQWSSDPDRPVAVGPDAG